MKDKEKALEPIKNEIFSLLDQLNEQQQKEFVWRSGVRSLAFISDNVSLKFWEEVDIEPVFDILDLMSYGGKYVEEVITEKVLEEYEGTEEEIAKKIARELSLTFENAADIEYCFEQLVSFKNEADTEIPEHLQRKYHQSDDYFDSDEYYDLSGSILEAFRVIEALWTSAQFFDKKEVSLQKVVEKYLTVTAGLRKSVDFAQTLLNDLKATIAHQKPTFSVNLYQKDLSNFDKAMRKIKGAEKANLYTNIWNNNFEMSVDDLMRRIYYLV